MIPELFRDARLVVLDKPAGLPVHAGPRGGASVEDCFDTLSRRRDGSVVVRERDGPAGSRHRDGSAGSRHREESVTSRHRDGPWLAHRLDADTAGCLVVALRRSALLAAQALFAAGQARKTYWAVVRGLPPQPEGVIDAPLAKRTSTASGWRMVADAAGSPAITAWRVAGRHGDATWLELQPRTGRTHQLRVHCALLGCPILGDPIYGDGQGTLQLLARAIALPLDPPVSAVAPVPAHMPRWVGADAA